MNPRILMADICVDCRSQRLHEVWITQTDTLIIHTIFRKPNLIGDIQRL